MRELSRAHQELMKIVSMDIPNRKFFENKVKDIYIRHVYQEKYESDVIGELIDPGVLDRKAKQWLGNAISLLVLQGYLGLKIKNEYDEYKEKFPTDEQKRIICMGRSG